MINNKITNTKLSYCLSIIFFILFSFNFSSSETLIDDEIICPDNIVVTEISPLSKRALSLERHLPNPILDWKNLTNFFEEILKSNEFILDQQVQGLHLDPFNSVYLQVSQYKEAYLRNGLIADDRPWQLYLTYPESLKVFIESFNSRLDNLVSEGTYTENDLIYIGFPFINDMGHIIPIRYGEKIPEGYRFYALEDDSVLLGSFLWDSISKGIFPVSNVSAFHDLLGHIVSYDISPSYAVYYRMLAKHLVESFAAQNVSQGMKLSNYFDLANSNSHFLRVSFFNEHLFLMSQQNLVNFLGENKILKSVVLSYVSDYNDIYFLKKMIQENMKYKSYSEKLNIFKSLKKNFYKIMVPLGGVLTDLARKPGSNLYEMFFINDDLSQTEKINNLDKFLEILVSLSELTIEDWYEVSITSKLTREHKVYKVMCEQVYTESNEWFRKIFPRPYEIICSN